VNARPLRPQHARAAAALATGHKVETAYERGWAEISNGALLAAAEVAGFEVIVPTDQSIRHQQNLTRREIALVLIDTNDWVRIRKSKALVLAALSRVNPGEFIEVEIPRE
jgi:hypothetical protein